MPIVSVIIPTFNYGKYISNAIDSVLEQSYESLEVVVIDDGSTDETKSIIKMDYRDKVRYIFQENSGAQVARNRGIEKSEGEYLIFLDADDALGHDQVLSFLKCSVKHPNLIIYGPWVRYSETDGEYKQILIRKKYEGIDMLDGWLRGWYITPCCIFWPRRILEQLGGWDEALLANQDGDIAMRALIDGFNFHFCPCAPAFVRSHSSEVLSISSDFSPEALYSRLYVLKKTENLLREKNLFRRYQKALSEGYYDLGLYQVMNQPDFARDCYRHFRRLRGFGRPPGTILNWLFVTLLGMVNKEKLARWAHSVLRRR